MAHGDYTVVIADKKPKENLIPKPDGFVFDSDEDAKSGQLITVRVKAEPDDDTKLCVTEIEGMPLPGYDKDTEIADIDEDGE